MAAEISISIVGIPELAEATRQRIERVNRAERIAVEKGAKLVEQRLQERTSRVAPNTEEAIAKKFAGKSTLEQRLASLRKRIRAGGLADDFLYRRTGALAKSIGSTKAEAVGGTYEARAGFREGVVPKYAAVQEFGATIQVPEIRPRFARALRFQDGDGNVVFARLARAHTVTVPARAPVRKSLEDRRDQIIETIRDQVLTAWSAP